MVLGGTTLGSKGEREERVQRKTRGGRKEGRHSKLNVINVRVIRISDHMIICLLTYTISDHISLDDLTVLWVVFPLLGGGGWAKSNVAPISNSRAKICDCRQMDCPDHYIGFGV